MTLKQLPSKEPIKVKSEWFNIRHLSALDGFQFSFGFWIGTLLFFLVVAPAIGCIIFLALATLGVTVQELLG